MATNELGRPVPELGIIEQMDVRQVWAHEAHDFTVWLAENLTLLGDALQMDLEPVQREAPVGDFSLDILARERHTQAIVVVENQLEWTDHSHLGQVLTYAAGHDARTIVWVSPSFRDEHRAALDWLNRWTPEEIGFFGVEIRAIRIGGSLPAPEFRLVAFPNNWSKIPPVSSERQFFGSLRERFTRERSDRVYNRGGYLVFPSGVAHTAYGVEFHDGHLRAYLWVNMGNGERKHQVFGALQAYAEEFQSELSADWFWDTHGNRGYAACGILVEGSIDDPAERLKELEDWAVEHLPKLKEVLNPRLQEVMAVLETDDSAASEE